MVPVGDSVAFASAIEATLTSPPDVHRARAAVRPYAVEQALDAYKQAMLGLIV
jgi:hypothetical protein